MPTRTVKNPPAGQRPRPQSASKASRGSPPNLVAQLRSRFHVPRRLFARLGGISERTLAEWESGGAISQTGLRKIHELERFQAQLAEVVDAGTIPQWLQTPNPAFEGLTPLEVIERGQIDRLWRMIFFLQTGVPS